MVAARRLDGLDLAAEKSIDGHLGRSGNVLCGRFRVQRLVFGSEISLPMPASSRSFRAASISSAATITRRGKHAERALDDAHILVGDEGGDAGIAKQRLDEGNEHDVIGAQQFFQDRHPRG